MQQVLKRSTWLVALLALISCVTVNIYFPAAAAEKAADSIIQDVWQEQNRAADTTMNIVPEKEASLISYSVFSPRHFLLALLEGVSSSAQAESVNFNASSPQIEQIKNRMANRFSQLKPLFDSGAVGLTDDAYLAIRDAKAAPMAQRAKLGQLVEAENSDRKALYLAIAEANDRPGWFSLIQKTFASRWISQAQSGWWYQSSGSWVQK